MEKNSKDGKGKKPRDKKTERIKFWRNVAVAVVGGFIVYVLTVGEPQIIRPIREWLCGGAIVETPSPEPPFTPTPPPTPTPTPTPRPLSQIMFEYHDFVIDQRFNVYTYPSESSFYSKAKNGDPVYTLTAYDTIHVAGYDKGWLLISYPTIKGLYRIGYTKDAQGVFDKLQFDNYPGEITDDCDLTDGIDYIPLSKGTPIKVLGRIEEGKNEGIYIEVTVDGKKARGIVPISSISWQ